MDEIRKHPAVVATAAFLAAVAGANSVPQFVDQTIPWFTARLALLGDFVTSLIFGVLIAGVVYLGVRYLTYRDALRKVVRDYIVEVADLNTELDPDHYGPMSDGVKRGEETADPAWGNKIIAKYGLPPEKDFR